MSATQIQEEEEAAASMGRPVVPPTLIPTTASGGLSSSSAAAKKVLSGAENKKTTPVQHVVGSAGRRRRRIRGLVKSGWSSVRGKNRKSSKSRSSDGNSVYSSATPAVSIAINSNYELENEFLDGSSSALSKTTVDAATSNNGNGTDGGGLDLVVLLMDPISHRFELLQIEFEEKSKAKVSDLLTQIPISVTEPSLKSILYDGILDHNYYRSSTTVEILTKKNTKNTIGNDKNENEPSGRGQYKLLPSSRIIEAFGSCGGGANNTTATTTTSKSKSDVSTKMVLVARPTGISDAETLRLARPILINKDVSKMLELSGFDVSGWKSKKFPSNKADNDIVTSSASMGILKNELNVGIKNDNNYTEGENSLTSLVVLSMVVLLIVGNLLNSIMIQPIPSGAVLKSGTIRSKCGIFGYVTYYGTPSIKQTTKNIFEFVSAPLPDFLSCEDEFLVVGHSSTTMYDSKNKISMMLTSDGTSSDNNSCNLTINNDDHSLEMCGKTIKQVLISNKSYRVKKLSPWPFEVEPTKLRYRIGSSKLFELNNNDL